MSNEGARAQTVESRVPARLGRLPSSQCHRLVIAALGITWILDGLEDGLEVTMVGNVAAVLTDLKSGLGLSKGQVGLAGGIYIAGACSGALFHRPVLDTPHAALAYTKEGDRRWASLSDSAAGS